MLQAWAAVFVSVVALVLPGRPNIYEEDAAKFKKMQATIEQQEEQIDKLTKAATDLNAMKKQIEHLTNVSTKQAKQLEMMHGVLIQEGAADSRAALNSNSSVSGVPPAAIKTWEVEDGVNLPVVESGAWNEGATYCYVRGLAIGHHWMCVPDRQCKDLTAGWCYQQRGSWKKTWKHDKVAPEGTFVVDPTFTNFYSQPCGGCCLPRILNYEGLIFDIYPNQNGPSFSPC